MSVKLASLFGTAAAAAIGLATLVSAAPLQIPRPAGDAIDRIAEDTPPFTPATAATVNGRPVSDWALSLNHAGQGASGNSVARGSVLDGMIDQELLYQEAERLGLLPSDGEVSAELAKMRAVIADEQAAELIKLASRTAGFSGTIDEYFAQPEFRQAVRKLMAQRKLISEVTASARSHTEAETLRKGKVAELRQKATIVTGG